MRLNKIKMIKKIILKINLLQKIICKKMINEKYIYLVKLNVNKFISKQIIY